MKGYVHTGVAVLAIAICCYAATMQKRGTCSYASISPTHTMCIATDKGTEVKVDTVKRKEIVDRHNFHRTNVKPSAGRMIELVWDEELALIATKWAKQCVVGHDDNANRRTKAYPSISIGQNGAYDVSSWTDAVDNWHSEVSDFLYGTGSKNGGVVGHYTQIVNENAVRVGCGQAKCAAGVATGFREMAYVCNYGRGQYSHEIARPYLLEKPCEECPHKCDEKYQLCYCNGKLCQNGGRMILDSCTCNCTALYTGEQCETINCIADGPYCELYKDEWCGIYSNVPQECPKKCKIC